MPKTICNILIELGILALIIVPPIVFGAVLFHHITNIQLLIWALGWVWLAKSLIKQSITYIPGPLDLPIILLLLWSVVNLITSTYQHRTELALYLIGSYALLYFLIVQHLRTVRRLVGLAFMIVLVGSGESLFGLIQYLRGVTTILGHPTPNIGTVNATYFSHNHFAGFLILIIPIALGLFIGSHNLEKRGFLGILIGLMVTALVLSLSRGGLFSFAVAMVGFSLCLILKDLRAGGFRKRYLIGGVVLIFGIGSAVAWIGISPMAHRSLSKTFLPDQETFTEEIRFKLWRNALPLIREFPVFGSGLGTFEYVFQRYRPEALPQNRVADYAHNDYMELAIEMGLPALVLVFWGIGRFYSYGVRAYFRHSNPVLIALLLGGLTSCAAILIHSVFDFNLQIPANALLFVTIAAMTTATAHLLGERQGESHPPKARSAHSLRSLLVYDDPWTYRGKISWKHVVLALTVLALLGFSFRQQVALRYYAQGNSGRALGQFFTAIPAYQQAIAIDPWNADYYEGLAQTYRAVGETTPHAEKWYRLAIETFQKAAHVHPYQAAFYYHMGELFDRLDQEAEAIQAFQRAVQQQPRLAFYHENLGHYLLYVRQTSAAFAEYRLAIELDSSSMAAILELCRKYQIPYDTYQQIFPDTASLRKQFAEWLLQNNLWAESKIEYRKAIELSGGQTSYYDAMLAACQQRQDYDCLRAVWQDVAERQPDNLEVRQQIAESYAQQQQWDQALREYEALAEQFPQNPGIVNRMGQLYQQLGQWDEAIRHYQRLITQTPEQVEAYHALAKIYRQQQHWQAAVEAYQGALAAGLTLPEIHAELGLLHEQLDDPDQALAAYERAVQAGEQRFNIYQRLATLYAQSEQAEQIPILWSLYVVANNHQPTALFTLAQYYHAHVEWLNAVNLTKEIIAIAPTQPEYRIFLANLYMQQQMTPEAIEQWEKLVTLNASNIDYHWQLAALYEQVKDWGQARTQYRRILQLAPNHAQAQHKLAALGE